MGPTEHLAFYMRRFPLSVENVQHFISGRGKDLEDWPSWCFLPIAGWYSIVSLQHKVQGELPLSFIPEVGALAALGTWRYSQGIYRFDDATFSAIAESKISGNLPSDIFTRLPEWCIYVETHGLKWMGMEVDGFWAHLEWDVKTRRKELRFAFNMDTFVACFPVHLGDWTLQEAIDRSFAESKKQSTIHGYKESDDYLPIPARASEIEAFVSILLYLCSDEPEIDDEREPGASPYRARPRKVKSGWRFFAPDKPRVWTVGKEIGKQLRAASVQLDGDQTTRTVKAHIRRAHWHGFWSGPKTEKRIFHYKWLPPILVAGVHDIIE